MTTADVVGYQFSVSVLVLVLVPVPVPAPAQHHHPGLRPARPRLLLEVETEGVVLGPVLSRVVWVG